MSEESSEVERTEEQLTFIKAPIKGVDANSIILSATAGSGKTASAVARLKFMLEKGVDPSKIIFFSFTVAAVEELKSRVQNDKIKITTIHSFCVSMLGRMKKLKTISTFYDFIDWFKEYHKPKEETSQKDIDKFYSDIENLYDAADNISSSIAVYKLQTADNIKCKEPDYLQTYLSYQKQTKTMDFSDMLIVVKDSLKEDKWLKMFRNHYEFVFIDEYQDCSSIMVSILLSLNAKCYYLMGDRAQCVIEGTKVHTENGIKNIEELKIGDKILTGKGSNNLDYRLITNVFKKHFLGEVIKIKTKSGKELTTTKEHTHFAKYIINEKELFFTYLMYKKGYGFRIGVTRSYHNNSSYSHCTRFGFMNRLISEGAQKIWLLEACDSESISRFNEIKYSLKYGLPTVVFSSRSGEKISNQEYIDMVFKNIETESGGLKLLQDKEFDFNIPHHFPKSTNNELNDRNINICLCADGRGKKTFHKLEIYGDLKSDKEKLINIGLTVQNSKKNGWRIRKQSTNYEDLINIKNKFLSVVDGNENKNVLLKKGNALNFTKASYLLKGMTIYSISKENSIEYDIIESVEIEKYDGFVYDINVKDTHNFIANGIFTHNSIYGYSGANCDAVEAMLKRRRQTVEMHLSINFRSTTSIVENSNKHSHLQAIPFHKEEGKVHRKLIAFEQLIEVLKNNPYVAVLVRTNSVIKEIERRLLILRVPIRYENYLKLAELEDIKKNKERVSTKNKIRDLLQHFESVEEIISFIELNKDKKSKILSIHKSKGLEFPVCVVVNSISKEILTENNITIPKEKISLISYDPEEMEDLEPKNVHYVSISRSQFELFFMIMD